MTSISLKLSARLARASFALHERVPLSLSVETTGSEKALVPDPTRGGSSLALHLRRPSGAIEGVKPGEAPPPAGTRYMEASAALVPGDTTTFEFDLARLVPLIEPGDYALVVEYTWAPGERWRSDEIAFRIAAPAGAFLDVTPNEASGAGYHGVIWTEAEPPQAARALLFDHGVRARVLEGALDVRLLPIGAEPALSTAPAGLPNPERWIAWIHANTLHAAFYTHGDASTAIDAQPLPLPGSAGSPRLLRPLLAEDAPAELRPRCVAGVLAQNPGGGKDLHVIEIDRSGAMSLQYVVPMAGAVVEGWTTAPTARDRLFVFALESPGWVHVIAVSAPWDAPCGAPAAWFVASADRYLAGDVRSLGEGRVRVGLLLRRGAEWIRVAFTPPAPGEQEAAHVVEEPVRLPADADPVRLSLDAGGRVHLLYRRGNEIFYLPPGASVASWSSVELGPKAPDTARLVLRPGRGPMLVLYHADLGATLGRI